MNMQIRSAEHEETRRVISSLQDRVRSLATIHRDLYQSQEEGRVNAGALVSEILDHSMEMTEDVTEDRDIIAEVDPVFLYPDQAVPLSLLVAEAMTNTLKYLGHPTGQKPWIVAKLNKMGSQCTFTLANSVGQAIEEESTGLGSDLINAFAIQLGGKITIDNSGGRYEMQVTFPIADFVPESKDF